MTAHHSKLYRRDTKGNLRVWWVETHLPGLAEPRAVVKAQYRIWDGLAEGNPKASDWTIFMRGKNLGKANETSAVEQCELEVKALYAKKLDRKYHRTPECNDPKPIFPMLAQTYTSWEDLMPKGADPALVHVASQPKLDGIRCIASKAGLMSREGQPHRGLDHIEEALKPFFEAFPDAILDGELYNHELRDDFNTIVSAVKRGDLELAQCIQYHVYDTVMDAPFGMRKDWLLVLDRYTSLPIVRVQTHMVPTLMALDGLYLNYLDQGYEGQIIRLMASPYEQSKRSKYLLKRKEFQDAEFPLVSLEEGTGNYAGCAKRGTFMLPDGRTFGAGVRGKRPYLKDLLARFRGTPEVFTEATIQFFRYTPDGIPRFPTVKVVYEGARDV